MPRLIRGLVDTKLQQLLPSGLAEGHLVSLGEVYNLNWVLYVFFYLVCFDSYVEPNIVSTKR